MAKFGVWKSVEKAEFQNFCVFEGCGDSRMSEIHFWGVQRIFENFLIQEKIFSSLLGYFMEGLQILGGQKPALNGKFMYMEKP